MPLPDFNALPQAVPRFIEPMYAKPVQSLPEGDEWLYEVKLDGYRCLAGRTLKGVTLWSRRGNVVTEQFPNVAYAAEALAADTLVDGEVVALDENGRISFNVLQHHRSNAQALQFYAFDLLMYRGRSLLNVPLLGRRELMAKAVRGAIHGSASAIRLSENFTARAIDLIRSAQELALEGIIAKKKLSTYESGKRTGAWVKYKTQKSEEFVVGGYTVGTPFDALVVGCYQNGKLLFVAKVRNGFVPHVRREVFAKFKGLETDTCPFANLPERKRTQWALTVEGMKECRWLRPELVAQVAFTEWTPDGHLREASFVGLRDDKSAEEMLRD